MRKRHGPQTANARGAQHRRNHAIADIERPASGQPSRIHEERRASWKSNERRVALPHVDERDVQAAVASRAECRPGLGNDPKSRDGQHDGRAPTNEGGADRLCASDQSNAAAPKTPGRQPTEVVEGTDQQLRWRHPPGDERRVSHEVRRAHQPLRADVCEPPDEECQTTREDEQRDDEHAGDLCDGHQRDREEIQREPRERHARKNRRGHWKERGLGRSRRHQHRDERRSQPRKRPQTELGAHNENGCRRTERQEKCRIDDRQRISHQQQARHEHERIRRRTAEIQGTASQVDDRHHGRAIDRRSSADEISIGDESGHCGEHRTTAEKPGHAKDDERQTDKDRDVAARYRDDVVGAGLLQSPFDQIVEATSVANHDCRYDACRAHAPTAHRRRDRPFARMRESTRRPLKVGCLAIRRPRGLHS